MENVSAGELLYGLFQVLVCLAQSFSRVRATRAGVHRLVPQSNAPDLTWLRGLCRPSSWAHSALLVSASLMEGECSPRNVTVRCRPC